MTMLHVPLARTIGVSPVTKGVVTNYGEGWATKRAGAGSQVKFYPYKKGDRNSFSHAVVGAQKLLR